MHNQLFLKRLKHEVFEKWKSIRSVVDWTIALYAVVPTLFFAGMYYHSLWTSLPTWMMHIPLVVFILLLFIILSLGTVRSFLEDADSLFLMQNKFFVSRIVQNGIIYSTVVLACESILAIVVLLPLLRVGYAFSVSKILLLGFLLFSITLLQQFLRRFISVRIQNNWELTIVRSTGTILMIILLLFEIYIFLVFSYLSGFFLILHLIAISFFIKDRLQFHRFFLSEIEEERKAAMSILSFIIRSGGHVQQSSTSIKPRLFPKSKRLWKKEDRIHYVTEAFIKQYIRNPLHIRFYLMVTMYSSVIIFIAPWWLTLLMLLFVIFALYKQMDEKWTVFANHIWVRLHVEQGEVLFSRAKAITFMCIPAVIWYGIISLSIVNVAIAAIIFLLLIAIGIRYILFP
ncbi:ABC transporter permease [Ectobacillus polymachus]|uniref:ABC transporter permease n=1 Tax=Ectobacillus polymachus TaxID=1508806 RepID=UPI003A849488